MLDHLDRRLPAHLIEPEVVAVEAEVRLRDGLAAFAADLQMVGEGYG